MKFDTYRYTGFNKVFKNNSYKNVKAILSGLKYLRNCRQRKQDHTVCRDIFDRRIRIYLIGLYSRNNDLVKPACWELSLVIC